MKKVSLLVLGYLLTLMFAGCGKNETTPAATQTPTPSQAATGEPTEAVTDTPTPTPAPVDINVAVLKGPTAIGMVRLMSSTESGAAKNNYHFTVAGTADEITASIIKGDIPVAAVPCNLAATLYNKTKGGVTVCAVNTLGVLYILDTGDSVQTLADLKGKTIYATGAGTTPEYTLRHLLSKAGIDPDKDVTITFVSEASEAAAKIAASDEEVIAMLPQPYVTIAKGKKEGTRVAIDITAEWEKVTGETLVTGVIVANTAFKAAVAKQAIPQCKIVCYTGAEMKKAISDYLKVLFDANPKAVGGALPGDDFYYGE